MLFVSDKLVKSLEDFFKKESDDMALLMNDVETESKGRAEFHYLHINQIDSTDSGSAVWFL